MFEYDNIDSINLIFINLNNRNYFLNTNDFLQNMYSNIVLLFRVIV